jgi:hypothetical protein
MKSGWYTINMARESLFLFLGAVAGLFLPPITAFFVWPFFSPVPQAPISGFLFRYWIHLFSECNPKSWVLAVAPYLLIQLVRSIAWGVRVRRGKSLPGQLGSDTRGLCSENNSSPEGSGDERGCNQMPKPARPLGVTVVSILWSVAAACLLFGAWQMSNGLFGRAPSSLAPQLVQRAPYLAVFGVAFGIIGFGL